MERIPKLLGLENMRPQILCFSVLVRRPQPPTFLHPQPPVAIGLEKLFQSHDL